MTGSSLPYDMGNAGDLLKHGWLTEWTAWWCECVSSQLKFLDPFGGLPWTDNPAPEVRRRVRELGPTTLGSVQCARDQRYYGSGHLVRRTAEIVGGESIVLVSDREGGALEVLLQSGLEPLEAPNFDPDNSYSIFDAEVDGDLLLVDPFARFLVDHAPEVLPKIDRLSERMAVLLFALDLDRENWVGQRYATLKNRHLTRAWIARCPKLLNTGVRGESKYDAEVALLVPREQHQSVQGQLSTRLFDYCRRLSDVLGAGVSFEEPREDHGQP